MIKVKLPRPSTKKVYTSTKLSFCVKSIEINRCAYYYKRYFIIVIKHELYKEMVVLHAKVNRAFTWNFEMQYILCNSERNDDDKIA